MPIFCNTQTTFVCGRFFSILGEGLPNRVHLFWYDTGGQKIILKILVEIQTT